MTKVVAIANQKGGVGKTTTAHNMGFGLADRGYKVLMVDFDGQGSLSVCCGVENPDKLDATIADLLLSVISKDTEKATFDDVVVKIGDVDLLPCNCYLEGFQMMLLAEQFGRESVLKRYLSQIKDRYDYVIIDCAPALNTLLINALVAADEVIIPFEPKKLSKQSIRQLFDTFASIKNVGYNEALKIVGFLAARVPRNVKVCEQNIKDIANEFGDVPVFQTVIPMNQNIEKATAAHQPVIHFLPSDVSAKAYGSFLDEYLR